MYGNDETFEIGKAKVVRKSDKDVVLVIAAGITMDQAVDAAAQLGRTFRINTPSLNCQVIPIVCANS